MVVCLLSGHGVAQAQARGPSPVSAGVTAVPPTRFSWNDVAGTNARPPTRFELAMQRGDTYALRAARPTGRARLRTHRDILVRFAIAAYEAAALADPTSPEPHLRAAEIISAHQLKGTASPNRFAAMRAIRHWDAFVRLAPLDPRIDEFIFRRSILFTRLGRKKDLERAIEDYARLLRSTRFSTESPSMVAQTLSNMAEVYMMIGRLDDAVAMYTRALEATPNKALYGYGLAVALDRDGQSTRAREIMLKHAAGDRLRDLRSGGVFFVPPAEIHYYLALGYEVLGRRGLAISHYQRFIASGAHPRFQPRARNNLNYLRGLERATPIPRSSKRRRLQRNLMQPWWP